MKLQTELGAEIPAQCRANNASTQEIEPCGVVAHHDPEILWDVIQKDFKGVFRSDVLFRIEDSVVKRSSVYQGEVVGVSCAGELEDHFHQFFAGELRSREVVED